MKEIMKRKRTDLFSSFIFSFLFKNKIFLFKTIIACLFFYAIILGFTNPSKEENSYTTALFWGLFWSFFMTVSLGSLGRVFCGICPHGFIGKYITKIGLKKKIPKKLANPFIGLGIILIGYWLLITIFPGIYSGPYNTAIFFAILTVLAVVFYFLYEDMAYCKYICPLGTVTKTFSKISFAKLETYSKGCSTCTTFDCVKSCSYDLKPFTFAKKNSMDDCTLCMDCAVSCDNVAFNLQKPSSSLLSKFKTKKVEVWTLLILTAILSFSMTLKHTLNKTNIADEFIWNKIAASLKSFFPNSYINIDALCVFLFSIISIVTLNMIGMYIASRIMKIEYEKIFYTLTYALIPLFIIGGLSHVGEFFFVHYSSIILNGFNEGLSLGFSTFEPLSSRGDSWLVIFKACTYIAFIWAFIIMIYRMKLLNAKKSLKVIAYPFASIVIIAYMILPFYVGYVVKTYGAKKGAHNHSSIELKIKEVNS